MGLSSMMCTAVILFLSVAGDSARGEGRSLPVPADLASIDVLRVVHAPSNPSRSRATRVARGACPAEVVAHTDSDFGPGQYLLQAGFEQGESAAISFTMPAEAFPVRLDLAEILFGTSATVVQTTTEWSIVVYAGIPTNGTVVAEYSSDGVVLPHLVMDPGTTGTIVQFAIDPTEEDQIFIPDNGSQTITVAFRVDALNLPGSPCISPPPASQNAFPATDVSGLAVPSGNWLDLVPGAFCLCGQGWRTFQQLESFCQPSGDWVMRATVTPFACSSAEGACCRDDGSCLTATLTQCQVLDGTYQGDETDCLDGPCAAPLGACCQAATESCVESEQSPCEAFGGVWQSGESCDSVVCFARGACCLPDGSCQDATLLEDCEAQEGVFQGDETTCGQTSCPEPEGWCCTDSGEDCFELTEAVCDAFGGDWGTAGSACLDADACVVAEPCPGDLNGDGQVAVDDILLILANYGETTGAGDVDGDGDCDVNDVLGLINRWGPC